jgi:ATP-dependent RNA helicase RhlE
MKFKNLGLILEIERAVEAEGYETPTPIQEKAIPMILSGGDLLAGAQTGTGKTAGFTLPLLQRLAKGKSRKPRALILVPTRELAAQVHQSVATYGQFLPLKSVVIFGGVNIHPQIKALRAGVDIIIATPGRLLDHVGQRTVDLTGIEMIVLDEADRMLDMGFIRDIRKILEITPKSRQTLLFSATFSREIKQLATTFMKSPQTIEIEKKPESKALIEQRVHPVEQRRKKEMLIALISGGNWDRVLVFTRTKHGANRLSTQLREANIRADAIHGNKSQAARTQALRQFKSGDIRVLVATDVAARGIDIDDLPYVVNYELPNCPDDYVHRIGRTGRAGKEGIAVSLVCHEERRYLADIERLIQQKIPSTPISGFEPKSGPRPSEPIKVHFQKRKFRR